MDKELKDKLDKLEKQVNELVAYKKAVVAKETARTSLENEFMEINTLDTFMKVKANTFGIGKVLFSFVKFDKNTNKSIASMDYYMDMDDALVFANDILSGRIPQLAELEKAKGDKYPKAVWTSKLGGINEAKAKERGRTDGRAESRYITLSPGAKLPFIFVGETRVASSDKNGLIVPDYKAGPPEVQIRVGCSSDDLKRLAISIQSNINAYRAAQYANGVFEKRF